MKKTNGKLDLLLNPKVVIASMILGVLVGAFFKELSHFVAPAGNLYMALLSMCITPLLIVSISSSIASLIRNDSLSSQLKMIAGIFPLGMLSVVGLGILLGYLGEAGQNLSPEAQSSIGKLMVSNDTAAGVSTTGDSAGIMTLLKMMIPKNIFMALNNGNNLAVLFFSIFLGASLGFTKHKNANMAVGFLEVMYEAFSKMIGGIMYGLPIGLFCLFAHHISNVGLGIVFAVGKFIVLKLLGCALIIALVSWFIKRKLNLSWVDFFKAIKQPALVAFATSSSLASIPAILNFFDKNTNYSKDKTHLFVPLSICLNAIGASFIVALTAIYMMDLYGISLGVGNFFLVLFGSVFSAIAMSGAPGIGALAMLGIVLTPLGIPLEPAILISVAVLPVTEGAVTLSNVLTNIGVVAFLSEGEEPIAENALTTLPVGDVSRKWKDASL